MEPNIAVEGRDFSLIGLISHADPFVQAIMLLLAVCSVLCWALIFEKAMRLMILKGQVRQLARQAAAGRLSPDRGRGIVGAVADGLIGITGGDATVTTLGLIWLSGVASAIVDNIPYTATMIEVVRDLGASGVPIEPLWWALALGACLGGNATIVGASANVVVANLAGRAGHPISFAAFLRYGLPVTVMSLVVATLYTYVRYLL